MVKHRQNKYAVRAHTSERVFRLLVKAFALDMTATAAADLAGVNPNTAQTLFTRLRRRVMALADREAQPFAGAIEADESYFGRRRVRGQRGRGAGGKIPVFGLLERRGRVYTAIVPDVSKKSLVSIIRRMAGTSSTLYTDSWRSYDGLVFDGYKHYRVHHGENEFARGHNHINGIEAFWGFAKTRMAKLRGIRREHFPLHLKESEWRWNHRSENLYQLILRTLREEPLTR